MSELHHPIALQVLNSVAKVVNRFHNAMKLCLISIHNYIELFGIIIRHREFAKSVCNLYQSILCETVIVRGTNDNVVNDSDVHKS